MHRQRVGLAPAWSTTLLNSQSLVLLQLATTSGCPATLMSKTVDGEVPAKVITLWEVGVFALGMGKTHFKIFCKPSQGFPP